MNKLILFITFLALGFLTIVTTIDPNAATVWLASPDTAFDIARGSLMFMLVVLMFTNPPRNVLLRGVIGLGAVTLIGWSGYMTYQNLLPLLDGIVFLAAGITSVIAVLEFEPDDAFSKQVVSPHYKRTMKTDS